ncbi:MAG: hypothetical protein CVU77_02735 [Elusimicrobia bacterium HGW-Elusimicrobia-1]|nr:MAG: hypothetical protein CVU77_02735 [Elusimicrobia bacterium HGW-Elusimicrobia-1]
MEGTQFLVLLPQLAVEAVVLTPLIMQAQVVRVVVVAPTAILFLLRVEHQVKVIKAELLLEQVMAVLAAVVVLAVQGKTLLTKIAFVVVGEMAG